MALGRSISRSRERLDPLARACRSRVRSRPSRLPAACALRLGEAGRALAHEGLVDAAALDQRPQHADEEREIAARVHVEPVVGEARAEQRARRDRRHPVPLQARLAVRVDDGDLRAALLGVMQVLGRDRLVVGDVGAEEDDQVGAAASRRSCTWTRRSRASPSSRPSTRRGRGARSCRRGWCRGIAPPSARRSRPRW